MEEGLGGDAPPVEAGAPHLAGLKEGHGQAALRGPEGGGAGGTVVACGTPEQVAACPESYTGQYLKKLL